MLNLLIIDKDVNNSKLLLNYISENSCQVRVHSLASSLDEGIKILNTGLIDITIINLNSDINSIAIDLSRISSIYHEKYRKSMLVAANNTTNICHSSYIFEYISPCEKIPVIFLKVNEIVKIKLKELSNTILLKKIQKELDYIGYNLSHYGAKYLAESIAIIYNNLDSSENLNKHVYPIIAQRYGKSINTIKGDIRTATDFMFYECDEIRLKEYFNFYTVSKPKPKLVIYTILNKINN